MTDTTKSVRDQWREGRAAMATYKMKAWCVVQQTERGEQFASDTLAFDPLRRALYIAVSCNESHAQVLLEEGKKKNPERFAGARIAPVVVEIREISAVDQG